LISQFSLTKLHRGLIIILLYWPTEYSDQRRSLRKLKSYRLEFPPVVAMDTNWNLYVQLNYAHPRSWRQLVLPISVRMSVRPSHIWFPLNNLCSPLANHLKCINQVSNHNRNVKFDFWLYRFIRFGDMPLDFPSGITVYF